jgi:toxin HigB-1
VLEFHNRNRRSRVKLTSTSCHPTLEVVICTFRHRGLRRLWGGDPSRIGAILRDRIENVLAVLAAASTVADLDLPGYRLHALKGELKGLWSVTVSGNWRITFRFEDGNVFDVDLTDYH